MNESSIGGRKQMAHLGNDTTMYLKEIKPFLGFPGGSEVKGPACNAGDLGSILEWGKSPGKGHDNPLQYSCLENPMDRGTWQATIHRASKSGTWLKQLTHTSTGGQQILNENFSTLRSIPLLILSQCQSDNSSKLVQFLILFDINFSKTFLETE